MWPWGHLAFGYLLYVVLSRVRFERAPGPEAIVLVALGTQVPDLIDKPLSWTFDLLASGRSLGHSVLAALLCTAAVIALYRRRRDRLAPAVAFGVGYGSHLLGDAILPVLNGEFANVAYLVYPLMSVPPDDSGIGFVELFTTMEFSPFFLVQAALVGLALAVWLHDGAPLPLVGRALADPDREQPAD